MYSGILEIIDVADTIDLTVLATAKEELGITDNSQDAKLTRWIHEASGAINAYVDRILARETVRETFVTDATGFLGPLPLRRYPVAFIDSLSMGGQSQVAGTYRFDMFKGLLYLNFGRWFGEVVVQYQAGYQLLGELPYDLERACLLLLQWRMSSSGSSGRDPSIRAESVPGVYEVQYWVGSVPGGSTAALPADVTALLAPYKDVGV
jgi:Phage gp6-like head-tail connector protein